MLKLKIIWNSATLDITNSGLDTIVFDWKEMIDVLHLRSLGYYKLKQVILQQNLSKYYRFEYGYFSFCLYYVCMTQGQFSQWAE